MKIIRARDYVGALPKDFGIAHYANIRFVGDKACMLWFGAHFELKNGKAVSVGYRVLRTVPISWLYQRP